MQATPDTLEASFVARRATNPDLPGAVALAFSWITPPDCAAALARTGRLASRVMDLAATAAPEPPYHNRHHVAEATLAMALLCRLGMGQGLIGPRQAAIGVAAMVGHDLGHDGSVLHDGALEQQASATMGLLAHEAGVEPGDTALLKDVILGTHPSLAPSNAARLARRQAPGPFGPAGDVLRVLANEADVCASLMPMLGLKLGQLLAEEWGGPDAPGEPARGGIATSRLAFLRRVPELSGPARALGLEAARQRGIAAFATCGRLLGVDETPDAGAAALDALPASEASEVYAQALAAAAN